LVDYEQQNQISIFLNDPGLNETNTTSLLKELPATTATSGTTTNPKGSNSHNARILNRAKYYTSLELNSNSSGSHESRHLTRDR
jgi:hypothetical protein